MYTAKDIREKRICFENLTEEQFNELKQHFQKLYPNDDYTSYPFYDDDISFRFYPFLLNSKYALGGMPHSYHTKDKNNNIKATKSITFDQFDFEEKLKSEYPKLMWVWNGGIPNPKDCKRVVFMEKLGRYLAWALKDSLEGVEKITSTSSWDNAEDIIEPEQLTKQQIADLLGKDINSFEII